MRVDAVAPPLHGVPHLLTGAFVLLFSQYRTPLFYAIGGVLMPLFRAEIQKTQGGLYWVNRYIISEANIGTAHAAALNLVEHEQAIHSQEVTLDKIRTDDMVPGSDQFIVTVLGADGAYAMGTGQLPLFNVVRVDVNVAVGRPSRKYYRVGLTETVVAGDELEATYRTAVVNAMTAMRAAVPEWVDVDGQVFVGQSVMPKVAMHQLRRGTRRKTTPVI